MTQAAHIASTEAIERFRTALILYRERSSRLLDEVDEVVSRTRQWLQSDQLVYWKRQVHARSRALETAKRELHRARLSSFQGSTELQSRDVRQAKVALEQAEQKRKLVKRWEREYDRTVANAAKPLERMRGTVDIDMGNAVVQLSRTLETLAAYADVSHTGGTGKPSGEEQNDPESPDEH